jgi:hypothetical protein
MGTTVGGVAPESLPHFYSVLETQHTRPQKERREETSSLPEAGSVGGDSALPPVLCSAEVVYYATSIDRWNRPAPDFTDSDDKLVQNRSKNRRFCRWTQRLMPSTSRRANQFHG